MTGIDQSSLYTAFDRDPAPIAEFIAHLRERFALPRPGSVLDMGCGPGRLLRPLAASGWVVTGYEPDPDYADRAEVAVRTLPGGRVRRAGFLDLDEVEVFDLIAAVNGPYSYLIEPERRREAIRRCGRALRPGGVLLLEFANFPWILENYRDPVPTAAMVGRTRVTRTSRHDIDSERGTFTHHDRFDWVDEDGTARAASKVHLMAMVSRSELLGYLADAGFSDPATYSNYSDRAPVEIRGRRILVAAQRSAGRPAE